MSAVAPDALLVLGPDRVVLEVDGGETARAPVVGPAAADLWRAVLAVAGSLPGADGALEVSGEPAVVTWEEGTHGSPADELWSRTAVAAVPVLQADPQTWAGLLGGRYVLGSATGYVVARATRGLWHVTGPDDARRSGLLDQDGTDWSPRRCAALGLPVDALGLVAAPDLFVHTDPGCLPGAVRRLRPR